MTREKNLQHFIAFDMYSGSCSTSLKAANAFCWVYISCDSSSSF